MSRLIDVMIIGAQKAGTTSLLRYLGEHPSCFAHPQKEFAFFLKPSDYQNKYENAFEKYYTYSSISENTTLIAKSAGLYSSEDAINRLHKHNPNCKLIILLRNPIERTYSSYLMEKNYGSVKFEFSDLPQLIQHHEKNDESWGFSFFIDYGLYASYLEMIYKYFPTNQVTVILFEDFTNSPLATCKYIFNKIGINPSFIPNLDVKHNITVKTRSTIIARTIKHIIKKDSIVRKTLRFLIPESKTYKYGELLRNANKTHQKYPLMDPLVKKFLINFYKPHNQKLELLINKDLSHWNN